MMEEEIREGEKISKFYEARPLSLRVALTAITAALYIALGYLFQAFSFLGVQFRVAELVVGMCIIFPLEGLVGKIIGVFFVNLFSPLGPIDLLSTIVNVPALYCIVYFRNKGKLKYLGGTLYAIIISLYVAIILHLVLALPIWLMFLQVLISELILANLGILLFDRVKKMLELEEK
ncbi:MAG: hypothetical protein GF383_03245 [Candidatus Lokiarchaeota archaeon]|nr:hypothetical protein [Candidatus Lokiarchaeota archaeon]MBD3338630.1 hypothetical protein [Candidatus Lokiarchaeota archaeon]